MLARRSPRHHLRGCHWRAQNAQVRTARRLCSVVSGTGDPTRKADDLHCVSTTFRFIGKNDRVCISAFDDPKVPGVAATSVRRAPAASAVPSDLPKIPRGFDHLPPGRPNHRRPIGTDRPGGSVFSAHVDILQAHPRLSSAGQEAQYRTPSRPCRSCRGGLVDSIGGRQPAAAQALIAGADEQAGRWRWACATRASDHGLFWFRNLLKEPLNSVT